MLGPHPIPIEIVPWIAWSAERVLLPVIVGALGALIAARLIGNRTSRFIQQTASLAIEQLIENIQPNLKISPRNPVLGKDSYSRTYEITAHDDFKPAKLLSTRLEASCTVHATRISTEGPDLSNLPLLTASSSRSFDLGGAAKCVSKECNWEDRLILRYEDYRGLRVYEKDSRGEIVILETRKVPS